MSPLTVEGIRRRFLLLTALRWLPNGLLMPVVILLPLDRGIGLAELGLAFSIQGFVVLALELPTGGLADAFSRRAVLVAASSVSLASILVFLLAHRVTVFLVAFTLMGVARALGSGPLEAWYVDTTRAVDRRAEIDRGLSGYGVVTGLAVAGGAAAAGGLVALDPMPAWNALAVPVALALLLRAAHLVGLMSLMPERRTPPGRGAALRAVRQTPGTIAQGVRLVRLNGVLAGLLAVELFWGFSMATFESLFPVRLEEILGDHDLAATITGPANSAAWLASAGGAALVPWLGRRLGIPATAALSKLVQAAAIITMGALSGVVGVVMAYLLCYTVHGAANPAHMTLLHRQATEEVRATVVSMNSMVAQPAGSVGIIVLTALAASEGVSVAMYLGGAVLALAAPLYLPAWRADHHSRSTERALS
jgi:hypothetical protein